MGKNSPQKYSVDSKANPSPYLLIDIEIIYGSPGFTNKW